MSIIIILAAEDIAVALASALAADEDWVLRVRLPPITMQLGEELVARQILLQSEGLMAAGEVTHVQHCVVGCATPSGQCS